MALWLMILVILQGGPQPMLRGLGFSEAYARAPLRSTHELSVRVAQLDSPHGFTTTIFVSVPERN